MKNVGFYLLGFLLAGCSVLKLPETFRARETDWRMWGGTSQRTNTAQELLPPLKLLWEYDASAGFSTQSIIAADSVVFIANLQGEVHAVNVGTGKRIGSIDFGSAIVGAPVVDGHFLYTALAQEEESLISYNLYTGRIEWRASVGATETSPLVIENNLIVVTLEGKIHCLKKYSGDILWTYTLPNTRHVKLVHSSPAANSSAIVVGCDDGAVYCVKADSGTLLWKFQTNGSIMSPLTSDGQTVYVASLDSTLYALEMESGKELWRSNLGGKIFGAIAVSQGKVYVGTAHRIVSCLDAANGKKLWSFTANGPISGGPLVSGSIIYVGSLDKTLYALDALTGTQLWNYATASRIRTVPIIHQNILIIPIEDRTVLAFTSQGEAQ